MVTDIRKYLVNKAYQFRKHVLAKEYLAAKADYDNARCVAVEMEIPEEDMIMLFGDRETGIDGLFLYDWQQKVYFETTVVGSHEWGNRNFEEFRRGLQAGTLNLQRWHQG